MVEQKQTPKNFFGFVDRVGRLAFGHFDAQFGHSCFEGDAVFTALDGVDLHADDFDAVLRQNAGGTQFRTQIQG